MDLDRGTLAEIDRKVLSGLGHDETYRMVRVPVSEAAWSTWKRYCDALGVSMGRAIVALVEYELRGVVGEATDQPVFLADCERRLEERETELDARERTGADRERWIRESERRRRAGPTPTGLARRVAKVGRNERCPCGSGLKYKHCHGLAAPRA